MIKYISKNQEYRLKNGRILKNPFIEPVAISGLKDSVNLRIGFAMKIEKDDSTETININEGSTSLHFDGNDIDTIVNHNGVEKDIEVALQEGWTYNENEIISWGKPSVQKLLNKYLKINPDLTLTFKNDKVAFLVKKYLDNNVMIEGKPLKENFELAE